MFGPKRIGQGSKGGWAWRVGCEVEGLGGKCMCSSRRYVNCRGSPKGWVFETVGVRGDGTVCFEQ